MNTLILIVTILDPKDKLEFIEFPVNQIYGKGLGGRLFNNMKSNIHSHFDDYVNLYASYSTPKSGAS